MGARGVFTVLGLTATAGAAYLALAPVSAELSTSIFPDWILDNVQFRLGGKAGVTVAPGSSLAEVTCGSPVSPYEIRVDDTNWLSDLVGQADRIEGRISSACGDAIENRQQRAFLAFIAAVVLFILALASRGRRNLAAPAASPHAVPGPPPGWYPNPDATESVRWWTGTAWANPPAVAPSGSEGPAEPDGVASVDEDIVDRDGERRRDRVHAIAAGIASVVVVVVVGVVVANLTSSDEGGTSAFVAVDQRGPTTVDPLLLKQQGCIRNTFDAIDAGFASAREASILDGESSSLNLDGDSSWRDFGEALRGIDTSNCPSEYRTTMIEFSNAWADYGEDWKRASKGLSFDGISDEDAASHASRINQANELLEDIASEHGISLGRGQYTID